MKKKYVYHLGRFDEGKQCDQAYGFVVVATHPVKARKLIADFDGERPFGDEGPDIWKDVAITFCKCIGTALWSQRIGVVLRDYRAG